MSFDVYACDREGQTFRVMSLESYPPRGHDRTALRLAVETYPQVSVIAPMEVAEPIEPDGAPTIVPPRALARFAGYWPERL